MIYLEDCEGEIHTSPRLYPRELERVFAAGEYEVWEHSRVHLVVFLVRVDDGRAELIAKGRDRDVFIGKARALHGGATPELAARALMNLWEAEGLRGVLKVAPPKLVSAALIASSEKVPLEETMEILMTVGVKCQS